MTTVNRALTAPTQKQYSFANVSVTDNGGIVALRLSKDRTTLYGVRKSDNTLMQSQNKGSTWSAIYTFPAARTISGLVEMSNGECLVLCTDSVAYPAYVYRSTGWSTTPANRAAATWTATLTTAGGQFQAKWSAHQWTAGSNGVVVVATYGTPPQSTSESGATLASRGRYLYVSEDFGTTWNLRFDLWSSGAKATPLGVHFHSAAYSELDDRIWATYGDNTGDGPNISGNSGTKQQLMYSDDRGLTWQFMDIPSDYFNYTGSAAMQFTTIGIANDGSLILQTDGKPYFLGIVKRTGYRTFGAWHMQTPQGPGGTAIIGGYINRDQTTGPYLTSFDLNGDPNNSGLSASSNNRSISVSASEDGLNWHIAYVDLPRRITASEYYILNLMGPTPDGKVVGFYNYKNSGAWATGALFTADLVGPA